MTDFSKLFSPASIAFLGASSDHKKWGYRVLANLVRGGYPGRIYPVNPKGGEILGLKVYGHLNEIPEKPDLAIIVVPPSSIVESIRECIDKGIRAGVVITAGFAEIGARGTQLQSEMLDAARKGGMRLVGPNCFGILNPYHKVYAQMPPIFPPAGDIAIVSQSGNVGITMSRRAMIQGFGVSRLVSIGNEADLHAEDFLEYLGSEDKTKVILSYLEGFKDGRRFYEVTSAVTRKKPVIMIKVGETEAGASAAHSHTAALSGADEVFRGICKQAGIVRVSNMTELLNVGFGFLCNPLPKGRKVAITTLGGGWGVLAADACAKLGLDVVKLSGDVLRELDSFLPGWWSRNNPVDLVAGDSDVQIRVIEILAKDPNTDNVIALGLPFPNIARLQDPTDENARQQRNRAIIDHYERVFGQVKEISKRYDKPIVLASDLFAAGPELEREIMSAIAALNAVCYSMPDEAAMVLSSMVKYSEYLKRAGA
jgi:acyl-CoA synthetase (NDP forming)